MPDIKRILCPVDFSDASKHALTQAALVATWFDARLTLLHVVESALAPSVRASLVGALALDPEAYVSALEQDASRRLAALVPQTARSGARRKSRCGRGRRGARSCAGPRSTTPISSSLGVHGQFALDHLTFGSTTNQVVRRAVCPVLTVRT